MATAFLAVVLLADAAPAITRPEQPPADLQQAIDRVVADGVPGMIALRRDGDHVERVAAGVADVESQAPMRIHHRYRIASITKSFVSTVILQLVGEGRLDLDDSVEQWLPGLVPGGSGITVRQLLNHTSGIFNYPEDQAFFEAILGDPTRYWAPLDIVAVATAHPPLFAPGAGWSYSNTNYILAGLVIEAVTHQRASLEVNRRILRPLRLWSTSFPLRSSQLRGHHTRGYFINLPPEQDPDGIRDVTALNASAAWTAGGMVSTVADVAKFHRALFTGQLLGPEEMAELMTTVAPADYGLGVFRLMTPCGPAWGHDGYLPGYVNISLTSPDGAHQAVLAINASDNLNEQIGADMNAAVETAFCSGRAPAAAAPGPDDGGVPVRTMIDQLLRSRTW